MAEWRFGRGWTDQELARRLEAYALRGLNFDDTWDAMTPDRGWNRYYSESVIAREAPGPPPNGGPFERARDAIERYRISDPTIVTGHFDPDAPLSGRRMALEIRVLGLRYLCGVIVARVRDERAAGRSIFGFRYDTLEGHIERGAEWFLLTKDHETGELRFRVEAAWRPGEFPNWWSRTGFQVLGPHYQRKWHHCAQRRLSLLARYDTLTRVPEEHGGLAHEGPEVIFRSIQGRRAS